MMNTYLIVYIVGMALMTIGASVYFIDPEDELLPNMSWVLLSILSGLTWPAWLVVGALYLAARTIKIRVFGRVDPYTGSTTYSLFEKMNRR